MKLVVFDLDNCISNDEWRVGMIDRSKDNPYDEYHSFMSADTPEHQELFSMFEHVAIITARPVGYYRETSEWLIRHGFSTRIRFLCMRQGHGPSVGVKRDAIEQLRKSGHNIVGAFDDRMSIVTMYRSMDIPAFQLKIHEEWI